MTARNSIKPLLDPGHDSVGTQVTVPPGGDSHGHQRHVPLGSHRGRRTQVTFKVEAYDERDKIAEGTHERGIVNVAKFATRVAAKAETAGRS